MANRRSQHSGPAPCPHAYRSKSCHGHLMDIATSVIQHVAYLLIRRTSYPNLQKCLAQVHNEAMTMFGARANIRAAICRT